MRRPPSREPRAPAPEPLPALPVGRPGHEGGTVPEAHGRRRLAPEVGGRPAPPRAGHGPAHPRRGHGAGDVARHLAAHGRLGPPRGRRQAQVVPRRLEGLPRPRSGEVGVERGGRGHLARVGHGHEEAAAPPPSPCRARAWPRAPPAARPWPGAGGRAPGPCRRRRRGGSLPRGRRGRGGARGGRGLPRRGGACPCRPAASPDATCS